MKADGDGHRVRGKQQPHRLRAGMVFAMHLAQAAAGHVRINFGCGDADMPKQFLNDPQVSAVFQQMGCEAVAQHVRGDIALEAGPADPLLDPQPECPTPVLPAF